MINKIGNWVFGSFFRTIGRLLVFVLLGFIIANLVDFSDITTNFRITDLFFEKVNALSLDGQYSRQLNVATNQYQIYAKNRYGLTDWTYTFNTPFKPNNEQYAVFNFKASVLNDIEVNDGATPVDWYNYWPIVNQITPRIQLLSNNGATTCELQNNLIVCELFNNTTTTYSGLYFEFEFPTATYDSQVIYTWVINNYVNLYKTNTQSIIENQNQNTQQQMEQQEQQHEEMMDSNTTQAQDEAEGFFGDFSVPDTGGLSGIITAPLNTIRSLLNSTCTNLVLPLPFVNQNLTLPCLYDIYNEHFGAFFSIYQTIILAIVAYRCIRSIYFDIHGFMDPNDDRIEVMDL